MNPPLRDWRGKRAWVVGASSGIGLATAAALHAAGAHVTVSARNRDALDAFVRDHPGALALELDVVDPLQVRDASRALLDHGPLDLAIYCAGYWREMQASRFDIDEMLRHQQVNYVGALHMLDSVLPVMLKENRGHISLVSSVAGFRGLPRSLAYGPTKAALINLAESLHLELHSRGIGVSLVNPGFVATPLTAQNQFRMPAIITPETAAHEIMQGWARGEFEIHFPKRFTRTMKAMSLLPFRIYRSAIRKVTGA